MPEQPSVPKVINALVTFMTVCGLVVGVLMGLALIIANVRKESASEFFDNHRDDLDRVARLVAEGILSRPVSDWYYGPALPDELDQLSATGTVTILEDGSFFIPRWTGIPDDAGGFWHSGESPEGRDMYGMWCADPVDLDGDWWACGLDW